MSTVVVLFLISLCRNTTVNYLLFSKFVLLWDRLCFWPKSCHMEMLNLFLIINVSIGFDDNCCETHRTAYCSYTWGMPCPAVVLFRLIWWWQSKHYRNIRKNFYFWKTNPYVFTRNKGKVNESNPLSLKSWYKINCPTHFSYLRWRVGLDLILCLKF